VGLAETKEKTKKNWSWAEQEEEEGLGHRKSSEDQSLQIEAN